MVGMLRSFHVLASPLCSMCERIENTMWLPSIASAIFAIQYVLVVSLVAMPEVLLNGDDKDEDHSWNYSVARAIA